MYIQGEYEQLAKQCQDFAVELLDQTRSSKELEVILNHDSESVATVADSLQTPVARQLDADDNHMHLTRLKLAIKCKQKRVSRFARSSYRQTCSISYRSITLVRSSRMRAIIKGRVCAILYCSFTPLSLTGHIAQW